MTRQLFPSAKVLLFFLLIHRKVAWSFISSPLAFQSLSKPKLRHFGLVCLQQTRTEMFLLRSGDQRGLMGLEGRQEVVRFSSENPFSDLQSLLFHARQRWTGHVLGPHWPGQATLLQHKVIVGSGVHGVENIGVVWDPKLYRTRRERKKKQYVVSQK